MVGVVRIFVVHAHPVEQSYNTAVRERVVSALVDAGHEVSVALLGDGTDPGPDDLRDYDMLVFMNPIWWGAMPAQLLAWVQRVLGPWIDQPDTHSGESPLSTVDHLVAVVTHGSSRLINQLEGEPAKQLLERTVLALCAKRATFDWVSLYKLDRRSRVELEGFIEDAAAEVLRITSVGADG